MGDGDWRAINRANWDERTAVHLGPGSSYDLGPLRAGRGRLDAIVRAELGPVAGLRVLHLQCHFGKDTLTLAQQGAAAVVGLDFSAPAIEAARRLAAELHLSDRARFVEADLYDTARAIPEPGGFDLVFVTWGALCWLPDLAGWARIVAGFLRPGGRLYLAEGHPAALVFDDEAGAPDGWPGWFAPHFQREASVLDNPTDYADPAARLRNARTHEWMHPLGEVLEALGGAGLALEWLREHPRVTWRMFKCLVRDADGCSPGQTGHGCHSPTRCRRGREARRAPSPDGPTLRCDRRDPRPPRRPGWGMPAEPAGPRPVSATRGRTG